MHGYGDRVGRTECSIRFLVVSICVLAREDFKGVPHVLREPWTYFAALLPARVFAMRTATRSRQLRTLRKPFVCNMQPQQAPEGKKRHISVWKTRNFTCRERLMHNTNVHMRDPPPPPDSRLPGNRATSALSATGNARKGQPLPKRETVARPTPNVMTMFRSTGAKASWRDYRRRSPPRRAGRNRSSFWLRT